jgi:hypothetical protein
MMRSASVDLPWSMWAMIEKLRMWFIKETALSQGKTGAAQGSHTAIKKGASAVDAP